MNICCGKTDGGGINADIKRYKDIPHFVIIKNIYHLPFKDKEFNYILCSHTIEHVDEPIKFYKELRRIGQNIVIVVPPLWDISASIMNILEHRWIFLTFKKEHTDLPKIIPLPFAKKFQEKFGQKITA